jgi:RNA polymerase sigma-70 factor (ECF subfamily)
MSDDEALAARARQGDQDAVNELLRHIRPEVLRRCGRLLPHPEDAEEACQDALLAIAQHITRFEGRSRFRTWAYAIVTNSVRQTYRKLRQRAAEHPTGGICDDIADARTTSVIAGTRIDLLDALEHLERDHPALVEPVVLRDLAQLEYREIAERLGLPEGTVKTHIHRARRYLQARLTSRDT